MYDEQAQMGKNHQKIRNTKSPRPCPFKNPLYRRKEDLTPRVHLLRVFETSNPRCTSTLGPLRGTLVPMKRGVPKMDIKNTTFFSCFIL